MSSIVDVARHAGVSITTVSRVLNKSEHPVNQETRDRVLRVAQELSYRPSALARALVRDETRIIGVIVGDISDPYFAAIARGIGEVALERGYLTVICNSDRIPDVELNFVQLLRDYQVDGIIFSGGGLKDEEYLERVNEVLDRLKARNVPVVALGQHSLNIPEVNIDNVQAARDMTEYLIQLGHRRIGYVTGPPVLTTSRLRTEGYELALTQNGIPVEPELVVEGNFTYESGQRAARQILSLNRPPTAIFAANDLMAIGCLTECSSMGIDIPGKVSVVGFDDIDAARYVHPALTTVRVPMREMGIMGMQQLLRMLEPSDSIETLYLLSHELSVRSSAAPPPSS
jgi:DNA-binding LacI/PurR family transcriptional regulator